MRRFSLLLLAGIAVTATFAAGLHADGPYKVKRVVKAGGDGGFDYVYADSVGRRLYVARSGQGARMTVFNLDTLEPAGQLDKVAAHGASTDAKYHHGFASSKPVAMWDTTNLSLVKSIDVEGRPDGILNDDFNHRTYVFSHQAPNATVIDAQNGAVLGTIDLGGQPEQAASDGRGTLYVDLEDKGAVAVVDTRTMKVTTTYSLNGKGGCAGLALDARHGILFVACREPNVMVMMDAKTGKYLTDLPIGVGCDGAAFNPKTGECFSSQRDGTLTVIKEDSPTTFSVEQTVTTMQGAKTMALDAKTGKVFLISAEYGAAAAGDGGNRGGRRQMVAGSFSIIEVGK